MSLLIWWRDLSIAFISLSLKKMKSTIICNPSTAQIGLGHLWCEMCYKYSNQKNHYFISPRSYSHSACILTWVEMRTEPTAQQKRSSFMKVVTNYNCLEWAVLCYNVYNMKKIKQNSQLRILFQNPQKVAPCAASRPTTHLFGLPESPFSPNSTYSKRNFNFKKTTLKFTGNRSYQQHLSTHTQAEPKQQQPTLHRDLKKSNYLSTLWKKVSSKRTNSSHDITPLNCSERADLSLRKTESCQTQSSITKSLIYGHRIDDFKLIKLLGTGRFGQAFMAKDKKSGFMGAIKILKKSEITKLESEDRENMMKQLSNEIRIQYTMNHPNVIKLYTFFHDADNIYLFMELGTDGHLLDLVQKQQHLQEQTTSVIVREVTRGVRYMHSKRIIHRDIKLQNVVLTFCMAKICDFGWATYEPKSLRETVCGTPMYLSPQILKGKKYDHKIDIWAIGILAHELAEGDNPFQLRKRQDLQKIITKDFQMKVGSIEFRSFINFILRKDPERRPDAELLMKHPFITNYKHIETAQQLCELSLSSQQ